jgi:pimeloyl-ACP methyl ester carboxylesterase
VDKGYKVISVQNPTTSLEDDVVATKRAIDRADGDVILVGHSWGGSVITEAGADPRVKALVYIAAFAPDKGETAGSLTESVAPTILPGFVQNANGYLTLSREGVAKGFAGDLSPKSRMWCTPFSNPLQDDEVIFVQLAIGHVVVRFWPIADTTITLPNVRFRG